MSNQQLGIGDALGALVSPGDVVAGKYRVQRVIGTGGMGVVIEAWHLQLDERVAIKFLIPEAANEEAMGRFEREARAAFKIKSEHVARVIDVGKLEGRVPYMVMEYLEGTDLGERLTDREPLSITDAVDYILQATEAVAEAHILGIVHRDLKPENLFVTRRPDGSACIKVLDFGLSKISSDAPDQRERALTGTKQVMGTPQYMSPEQWMSAKDVGPASDQWSLGVILYELLTGHQPFDQEHVAQLCTQVLRGDPPPLHAKRPDAPDELVKHIDRCLAKEADLRFSNVAEMALAIYRFGSPTARSSAKRIAGIFKSAGLDPGDVPESSRGGLGHGMVLGLGSAPRPGAPARPKPRLPRPSAQIRPPGTDRRSVPSGDEATLVHELPEAAGSQPEPPGSRPSQPRAPGSQPSQPEAKGEEGEEAPTHVYQSNTVTMSHEMRERFEQMLVDEDSEGEPETPAAPTSSQGLPPPPAIGGARPLGPGIEASVQQLLQPAPEHPNLEQGVEQSGTHSQPMEQSGNHAKLAPPGIEQSGAHSQPSFTAQGTLVQNDRGSIHDAAEQFPALHRQSTPSHVGPQSVPMGAMAPMVDHTGAPARPRRAVTAQSWQNMLPPQPADSRKKAVAVFVAILAMVVLAVVILAIPSGADEPQEPEPAASPVPGDAPEAGDAPKDGAAEASGDAEASDDTPSDAEATDDEATDDAAGADSAEATDETSEPEAGGDGGKGAAGDSSPKGKVKHWPRPKKSIFDHR